jgi:hemoglobin
MSESIYEQLGGFTTVRKIIAEFYNSVLNEDELGKYFANTDMERQIDHQTKFISQLLGGPVEYSDDHLQKIHARMSITDQHFDMIKEILCDTLEDFDLEDEQVSFVDGEFEKRRNIIVSA